MNGFSINLANSLKTFPAFVQLEIDTKNRLGFLRLQGIHKFCQDDGDSSVGETRPSSCPNGKKTKTKKKETTKEKKKRNDIKETKEIRERKKERRKGGEDGRMGEGRKRVGKKEGWQGRGGVGRKKEVASQLTRACLSIETQTSLHLL